MSGTVRFLDQKQVERLLQVPNTRTATGLRNACILRTLWETGLRIDECLSLKLDDINIDAKTVVVRRGKGKKTRTVAWSSESMTVQLETWLQKAPESQYVFPVVRSPRGNKGEKLSPNAFRGTFAKYVREAGLPEWVTPHAIRHSFATFFLRSGGNVFHLQKALGHANLSQTQVYTHVVDEDVLDAMRSLHMEDIHSGRPRAVAESEHTRY